MYIPVYTRKVEKGDMWSGERCHVSWIKVSCELEKGVMWTGDFEQCVYKYVQVCTSMYWYIPSASKTWYMQWYFTFDCRIWCTEHGRCMHWYLNVRILPPRMKKLQAHAAVHTCIYLVWKCTLANRWGCIKGCIGCINIQYIPIHAGCIGMYPKIRRMYWDVLKDVLDVNTSNTSSNTSDVLKTGTMYWSVLKDVSDVLCSWQDVLNDVLVCIESRQDVSSDVLGDVLTCIEKLQDVLMAVLKM